MAYLILRGDELQREIDYAIREAELMGYDLNENDPELMGGFIKRIIARIKAKRAARAQAAAPAAYGPEVPPTDTTGGQFTISTPWGTGGFSKGGISFNRPVTTPTPPPGGGGIMEQIKENPLLLAIPAGLLLLLLKK